MPLSLITLLLKLKNLPGFLMKNWQAAVIVVLLASLGGYHMYRTHIINGLTQNIATLEKEKAEIKLELSKCNGAITNQNEIIDTLKKSGKDILEQEKIRAAKKIAEIQARQQAELDSLARKPIAQTCEAAMGELREFAIGEQK